MPDIMPGIFTLFGCALLLVLMAATMLVTVLWLDRWHSGRAVPLRVETVSRGRGAVYVSTWARRSRPRTGSRTRPILLHRAGVKR